MKKVKLIKLSLYNFKGIKNFQTVFNGRTRIMGDNATGKTTLVDAFTWLLFGKDSTGRKDFSIKTYDKDNNIIHKLDHEVSGVFDIDGQEITLRRAYKEKWVTRRGSQDAELQGHETLFFWNDVPLAAGEYQAKVDEIITEQTFRMITSPWYFNNLKWQERREILTSIAGNVSDKDIASTNLQFSSLFADMGDKTLEEYKKEIAAKKKRLRKELDEIPARVDEVVRNTPEDKDWKAIENEIESLTKTIENIDAQLADSSKANEALLNKKRNLQDRIHQVKTLISEHEFQGRKQFSKRAQEKQESIENAKSEIEKINRKVKVDIAEIEDLQLRINKYKEKQAALREQWLKADSTQFPGLGEDAYKCPTCNQDLPTGEIESRTKMMEQSFNNNKVKQLADISGQGKAINPIIENLKADIRKLEAYDYSGQITAQEKIIAEWENVHLVSVHEILSNNSDYKELIKELEEIENTPEQEPSVETSELKSEKADLVFRVDNLKKELSAKSQIEQSNTRKKELLRQEKEFAKQLSELEQTEFTIQEFTRAKVDMLESKINSMFDGVKFRLFDTQINGGLIECCDTLIKGVPWSDANNAAKINAGIEIINVLSDHYGQIAPVWIDNAESITNIRKSNAQIIELYVSESYKELEVKVA